MRRFRLGFDRHSDRLCGRRLRTLPQGVGSLMTAAILLRSADVYLRAPNELKPRCSTPPALS
jgi:hypothetical protein